MNYDPADVPYIDLPRKLKMGDIVVLKSGSPFMTIEAVGELSGAVRCVWFDYFKRRRTGYFRPEWLREVPVAAFPATNAQPEGTV